MEEILLVAPYDKLSSLAKEIKKTAGIPFSVVKGNLGEGLSKVKSAINNGTKVILTRGGTAEYLRENLQIPVIEIPVTSFDMLNAIDRVSSKEYKKIAFITTSNIIFKTDYFNKIADITMEFESCKKVNEIQGKVKYLIENNGIEAVIGDVIATREAMKNGIYGELLESGQESIIQGLNEAKRILEISKKERARVKEFEAILNMIGEGVLTIDKENKVTVYNSSAERIFGSNKEYVVGNDINKCLPSSTLGGILKKNEEEKDILLEINDKKIVSNRIPIIIDDKVQGAVAIFEEISNIQKMELNIRKKLSEKGFVAKHTFSDIVGESEEMVGVKNKAIKYAKSESTILIYGETGTGKELFSQSIHNESRKANMPFVSVNCAALSESLLESELFGYEEGAFTGATKGGKRGLFELAHGGTLFLDEIGEISLGFQSKLLRVLQEKEVRRIGGDKVIPIDVRILCATNKNLIEEVEKGNFREDLYYRLSILELNLVPLRFRKKDIIPMAISFLKEVCVNEGKCLKWKGNDIFQPLLNYDWKGNARELRNFVERLVVTSDNNKLDERIVIEVLNYKRKVKVPKNEISIKVSNNLKEMESEILKSLINQYNGDKDKLCEDFNISKTTLWRKLNFKSEK
jgi:transcriptional regulator with PAS, ATPase and Fis domain